MNGVRTPRKPRWLPTADTMAIAMHRAAKPPADDMNIVVHILQAAFAALRTGTITELQFSILKGAITTAQMIERQRVVRGLTNVITAADTALDAIWTRITQHGTWGSTGLHHQEVTAVAEFVTLHTFQCRQLSRAEYLRAVNSARGVIGATGVVLYGSQAQEAAA
jgi:hypothetical protein